MPIKYIGKTTHFSGKNLYEILCKLKDFGVGRMVYRNVFHERYPEKSYYVITSVTPDMSDPGLKIRGKYTDSIPHQATANYVFRGKDMGHLTLKSGWKADWRLVPKTEEETFKELASKQREIRYVPQEVAYPPLLEYFYKKQMEASGTPVTEKLTLTLNPKKSKWNNAQIDPNL